MFTHLSLVIFSPSRSEVTADIPFTLTMSDFNYPKGDKGNKRRSREICLFSDENKICLSANDSCELVRRRPDERLRLTCLRPRHPGHSPRVTVWEAISKESGSRVVVISRVLPANVFISMVIQSVTLPFMDSSQRGVFKQDNARLHTLL
ncbi:transposable element Tc1 transposase [Trichonephila clavipes]|nr:transposable element Tc1 transposase [Trichonephila clavipes]